MNKIEELIEEISELVNDTNSLYKFATKLRTLLTTYTCEVAKIDEEVYKDADKIVYGGLEGGGRLTYKQTQQITEYNRLITEKYQAQPETHEHEQPSPNWWESLKDGDLVVTNSGNIRVVRNWFQEQIGVKRVFVKVEIDGKIESYITDSYTPYTPTPTEAIADLKNGRITEEQFKKVYKP